MSTNCGKKKPCIRLSSVLHLYKSSHLGTSKTWFEMILNFSLVLQVEIAHM